MLNCKYVIYQFKKVMFLKIWVKPLQKHMLQLHVLKTYNKKYRINEMNCILIVCMFIALTERGFLEL